MYITSITYITWLYFYGRFALAVENKNGTEDTDRHTSLSVKKELSTPEKEKIGEVKSSENDDEAGNGDNVNTEELGSPSVDIGPDEMFDEEMQPTEGIKWTT